MTGGRRDNERFFTPADSPVMDTTRQAGLIGNSFGPHCEIFLDVWKSFSECCLPGGLIQICHDWLRRVYNERVTVVWAVVVAGKC